jgi:hypothetical protein
MCLCAEADGVESALARRKKNALALQTFEPKLATIISAADFQPHALHSYKWGASFMVY